MSDCRRSVSGCGPSAGGVQNQRQHGSEEKNRDELIDNLTDFLEQMQDGSDLGELDRLLEDIERADPLIPEFDVERSLADFHSKYDCSMPEPATTPPGPKEPAAELPASKKSKRARFYRPAARTAIIAAVLVCFVIGGHAGVTEMISAWWSSSQFSFTGSSGSTSQNTLPPEDVVQYASLQEALDAYGVTEPLAPSELPEDTTMIKLLLPEEDKPPAFKASFSTPKGTFYILIRKTEDQSFYETEKNFEDAKPYVVGGIEHNLINDLGYEKAVWLNDNWECSISGELSRDELIAMIDSIYDVKDEEQ